jgi:hypothetical protein
MKTLMILLLMTTAASAFSVGRPDPGFNVNSDINAECAVVRVTPPDHDRNPGYKVELNITFDHKGDMTSYNIVHVLADGTEKNRSDQYTNSRFSWNPYFSQWSGWRGQTKMVGTFDQRRSTYTEVIRHRDNGKIDALIETKCHYVDRD